MLALGAADTLARVLRQEMFASYPLCVGCRGDGGDSNLLPPIMVRVGSLTTFSLFPFDINPCLL